MVSPENSPDKIVARIKRHADLLTRLIAQGHDANYIRRVAQHIASDAAIFATHPDLGMAEGLIPAIEKMPLFWHPTGPLVEYDEFGTLTIHDLNPEVKLTWRMKRWEMIRFGWRTIWAGLWYGGGE